MSRKNFKDNTTRLKSSLAAYNTSLAWFEDTNLERFGSFWWYKMEDYVTFVTVAKHGPRYQFCYALHETERSSWFII